MPRLKPSEKEEMRELIFGVNRYLLDLLELRPNSQGYLYSAIEDSYITVNGRSLRLFNVEKGDVRFAPVMNSKLMMVLFGLYLKKIKDEEGREMEYIEYEEEGSIRKNRLYLTIKEEGYDEEIKTERYYNDSLRLIDALSQIADVPINVDLLRLDHLINK